MRILLQRLARDRRGATAVEYGLIAGLVVVALVGGVTQFAGGTIALLTGVSAAVGGAIG